MAQIVPAIIVRDYQELEDKIKSIEGLCDGPCPELVEWVQIDVMDGKFVIPKTFNVPQQVPILKTNLKLEAHLMIEQPWDFINAWLSAGVKRILVHYESVGYRLDAERVFNEMISGCHMLDCEFGIAINPETPIDVLDPYILKIDTVQIMGVKPGWAGQSFKDNVLEKIQGLREKYPGVKIAVDGGVNIETAQKILKAGADILVVGSYIWSADDKKSAIEALKNIKT